MPSYDVVLIHAPSVYDFRERTVFPGPVSEVVPSLYVFDMYPIGFLTLASFLEEKGFRVAIFNLASKMLSDKDFNVPNFLERLDAKIYGIDLHWLVHAHGAIEIARMIKQFHPNSRVVLGGISSSYFWEEIMKSYSFVDFILRGDSTEDPFASLAEKVIEGDNDFSTVPNLVWRENSRIRVNPLSYVPRSLDYTSPSYDFMIRQILRTKDLALSAPFASFLKNPITAVLTAKGCVFNCVGCGGSKSFYSNFLNRSCLALKSPERIAQEVESIAEKLKAPIFILADIRLGGRERAERIIQELKAIDVGNDLMLEFFFPVNRSLLQQLSRLGDNVYIQISPETQIERVRYSYGRLYKNKSLEKMVNNSIKLGIKRVDLYFMTGLPLQTAEDAVGVAKYFEYLLNENDALGKLEAFTAPLAPFIDPGSVAFENPEKFGYNIIYRTFLEHRNALLEPHWKYILNYSTNWMDRGEIVEASLNAAERLAEIKEKYGIIDRETLAAVKERTSFSRECLALIENAVNRGEDKRYVLDSLKAKIAELMEEREFLLKKELYPRIGLISSLRPLGIIKGLIRTLF
ncbi:MAG: TIGR04190 family B12-binding domain/radical SAM domain protein [Thermoproteota archaeon]|nr:MAG: TIGR04190 family B12-binding domain/radical SAM domain protein [Candidatus Korarchaeota archaeon]